MVRLREKYTDVYKKLSVHILWTIFESSSGVKLFTRDTPKSAESSEEPQFYP